MQDTDSLLDDFLAIAASVEDEEPSENIEEEKKAKSKAISQENEDEFFLEKITDYANSLTPSTSGKKKGVPLNQVIDKNKLTQLHNGDTDSSDDEQNRDFENTKYNEYGRDVKHLLTDRASTSSFGGDMSTWKQKRIAAPKAATRQSSLNFPKVPQSDVYTDPFFGIRISKPLISSAVLKERMADRAAVSMAKVKQFITRENTQDWVISGVIVGKSPVKTSQKGSQYIIWTLSDLKDDLKSVAMFLFSNAYKDLWKTSVGTVLGVLNPSVLDQREGSKDQATLSVDNSQRVMIFGQSKDYGTCKSKKKDGQPCTAYVNTSQGEYCLYHIKQEYQKLSKRSELQANFAGRGLTALRNKVLGKNEVFYAGKSFMAIPAKKSHKQTQRDNGLLKSLSEANKSGIVTTGCVNTNKVKTAECLYVSRAQRVKDLQLLKKLKGIEEPSVKEKIDKALNIDKAILQAEDILKDMHKFEEQNARQLKGHSEFEVDEKLADKTNRPNDRQMDFLNSSASMPRAKTMITPALPPDKSNTKENGKNLVSPSTSRQKLVNSENAATPTSKKEALNKFIEKGTPGPKLLEKPNLNSEEYNNLLSKSKFFKNLGTPKLSNAENSQIDLSSSLTKKPALRIDRAKLNALKYIQKNGPLKKEEEKAPKKQGVKRFLETSNEDLQEEKKAKIADAKFTSERFKKIMEMQSKHTSLLEESDREKEEKYFKKLEIKEKMEEKMMTVFKAECKAVKCLTCKYTNFSASDKCKQERHVLKVFNTFKRFFKCGKCGYRTVSLDIIPLTSCKNCGGAKWERTTMMKERTVHAGESLSIRGLEEKYVGAINTGGNINLLVPDE